MISKLIISSDQPLVKHRITDALKELDRMTLATCEYFIDWHIGGNESMGFSFDNAQKMYLVTIDSDHPGASTIKEYTLQSLPDLIEDLKYVSTPELKKYEDLVEAGRNHFIPRVI